MKTTNILSITALVLALCACNKISDVPQPAADNEIIITATLAPKSPVTKAVSDQGTTIKVDWAQNEHIAILYSIGSTKYMADAEITSVDGSTGEATITFSVNGSTPDNTACSIVYPFSAAKADYSGVKAYADLLSEQDGTLNADLDVRVGAGNIRTATPKLEVTTQPAAQFAIFKLTFGFCPLVLTVKSAGAVVTTVSPSAATSATQSLYFALPPTASGTAYEFTAFDNTNKYTKSVSSTSDINSGYFYQATLSWTTTALTSFNLGSITENTVVPDGARLSGTINANVKVSVAPGATVVLDNATIIGTNDSSYKWAGITCEDDATIVLSGTNTLKGFYDYPGISISKDKTLVIQGTGSLNASSSGWAAGIGGAYGTHCGTIVIEGGTINAVGGDYSAGIGGAQGGTCNGIIITDGVTSVTATKGPNAVNPIGAGGGTGSPSTCGTIVFGGVTMSEFPGYPKTSWIETPTSGATYGGLTLTVSTTTSADDTWTLVPGM